MKRIAFNQPASEWCRFVGDPDSYAAIDGDDHLEACETLLAEILGMPRALMTTSGTHALEMAAFLLDLEEGAEVIMPSFTYPATATAFMLRGLRPVFVDVRADTLNIDETLIEAAIGPKTRAIAPVHYAGVACNMDALTQICERHGLAMVEDNAQGLFGTYRGKQLGAFGEFSAVSFHSTKSFACGAGGAIFLADDGLRPRAERIRDGGTTRYDYMHGNTPFYEWYESGSNYLPADILGAMLYPQLKIRDQIIGRRVDIWNRYSRELASWAARNQAGLPGVTEGAIHPAHLFYVLMPDEANRTRFIAHMHEAGVASHFHYYSLHMSRMGRELGYAADDCPQSAKASAGLTRLPLYPALSDDDVSYILEVAQRFTTV